MVNFLAVVVAALASMVVGSLWYGPLFGKTWMQLMHLTQRDLVAAKKKGMTHNYILAFMGSLLTAYVLSWAVGSLGMGMKTGIFIAFWVWLGFFAPQLISSVLWEGKSWKLYALKVTHALVMLLVMGAILGAWR